MVVADELLHACHSLLGHIEDVTGQLLLVDIPPNLTARREEKGRSRTAIGYEGEDHVEIALKYADPPISYVRHPVGREDTDFMAGDYEIQVKASESVDQRGRIAFRAGSGKRFKDYAGKVDFFLFVYVDHKSDCYGRMILMPASDVIRRWPGGTAPIYARELPAVRDLSLLRTPRPNR